MRTVTVAEPHTEAGSPIANFRVVDVEATRRHLTARQVEAVATLVRAAERETEEVGYAGLTVRGVARRAGVAPAHRRLSAALGPEVDPRVVRVLEAAYSGALLTAGIGHMSFLDVPAFLAEAATLLVDGTGSG
jgi:hypothetical protein